MRRGTAVRAVARLAAVALLAAGPVAVGERPAAAACRQQPAGGTTLAPTAGRAPVIARLGLERAWELSDGSGVTVAVVDTGVDVRQREGPVLAGGLDVTPVNDPRVVQVLPGGTEDCDGHGTAVAGLIAGRRGGDERVVGVAPGARVAPVRVVGDIGQVPPAVIAAAIRAGADRGAVLNLSFARPADDPAIRAAVQEAVRDDVVVVAAAGNEGGGTQDGQTWYPAAYPGVLAVAAVNDAGEPMRESNHGPWVGIAAPGEHLLAPAPIRDYTSISGTSGAAALVSGTAALVRARFPDLPAAEVVRRLRETATPVAGAPNDRLGAGLVDPFAALTATVPGQATGSPAPPPTRAVAVVPRPAGEPGIGERWGAILGWSGALAALAVLATLARVAVRGAARRRWRAGPDRGGGADGAPAPPAPPPDLRLT